MCGCGPCRMRRLLRSMITEDLIARLTPVIPETLQSPSCVHRQRVLSCAVVVAVTNARIPHPPSHPAMPKVDLASRRESVIVPPQPAGDTTTSTEYFTRGCLAAV